MGDRRAPGGRGVLRPDCDGSVPAAEPCSYERRKVDGDLRGDRRRHESASTPSFCSRAWQVGIDRLRSAPFGEAGSSALVKILLDIQHYGTLARSGFLRPLASAARVSRLSVRAIPQALGVLLVMATCSLLGGLVRVVPASRPQTAIKPFLIIAPLVGEDLDGPVPAGKGREVRTPGRSCALGQPNGRQALTRDCRAIGWRQDVELFSGGSQTARPDASQTRGVRDMPSARHWPADPATRPTVAGRLWSGRRGPG